MHKGNGEAQYTDSKPKSAFFNTTVVQLKKQGCQTRREDLKINMNIPNFIGSLVLGMTGGGLVGYWINFPPVDSTIGTLALSGFVFIAAIVPSLWVNEYQPLHSYDFQCTKVSQE